MFRKLLDFIVQFVYKIHQAILSINDKGAITLTDKQLHFIVIGIVGLILLMIVYPIFKWLAKKNMVMSIAWIYVFTILVAITLLIEIGQDVTGTGDLEFKDIVAGLLGFIVISIGYIIFKKIVSLIRKDKEK